MSGAVEKLRYAESRMVEKMGADEAEWPLWMRREITKLRRDARFEQFMEEVAELPTPDLTTTDDITQRSIEIGNYKPVFEPPQDIARIEGLLGKKKQMIVTRLCRKEGDEWKTDPPLYATLDADMTIIIDDTTHAVITVEWIDVP